MKEWQKKIYQSKEWKKTREHIKQRDKGLCFFCGALVLKRWTIHHKEELNDKNYLDYDIAFNENNLVLCHADCHDKHHERFGYKKTIVNDDLSINYERRNL